jgi:hypothetical protein
MIAILYVSALLTGLLLLGVGCFVWLRHTSPHWGNSFGPEPMIVRVSQTCRIASRRIAGGADHGPAVVEHELLFP